MSDKAEDIKQAIEEACTDLPRAEYRALLEEVQSYCEIAIEALDEDARREKRR